MARSFQVTFDAHDPVEQAAFWRLALDYAEEPPPDGFASWDVFAEAHDIPDDQRGSIASCVDPDGVGPRLLFLRVPEEKTVKNRVHLDINVDAGEDRREAILEHLSKLVHAGATFVRNVEEGGGFWVVCTDPEGNEFCIH
ncbi:MAG: VOC family protein [Acidimicrobiia bacterium]|nr:VOC family protein [Acidimicrobiia bacterium]